MAEKRGSIDERIDSALEDSRRSRAQLEEWESAYQRVSERNKSYHMFKNSLIYSCLR